MLSDAPAPIDADCVGFTGRMRLFTDGKAEPVSAHPHPLRTAIGASHWGGGYALSDKPVPVRYTKVSILRELFCKLGFPEGKAYLSGDNCQLVL